MRTVKLMLLSLLAIGFVKSAEIAVVAGKNFPVDRLSKNQIKKIFLKKKLFVGDKKVIPVNLKNSFKIRKLFQENVLNMDEEEYNLYWNEMYFNGIKPPIVLSSENSVISFVKKVDGAIGYVDANKIKNAKDIKILNVIKIEE